MICVAFGGFDGRAIRAVAHRAGFAATGGGDFRRVRSPLRGFHFRFLVKRYGPKDSSGIAALSADGHLSVEKSIGSAAKGMPLLMDNGGKTREAQIQKNLPAGNSSDMQRLSVLHAVLLKGDIPDEAQRMFVLRWFDTCHGRESELVVALQSEKLLEKVIGLLDGSILRYITIRLAGHAFGTGCLNAVTFGYSR